MICRICYKDSRYEDVLMSKEEYLNIQVDENVVEVLGHDNDIKTRAARVVKQGPHRSLGIVFVVIALSYVLKARVGVNYALTFYGVSYGVLTLFTVAPMMIKTYAKNTYIAEGNDELWWLQSVMLSIYGIGILIGITIGGR